MDDDDEKMEKVEKQFLSCRGPFRDLSWGTNRPKKLNPTQNYNFFQPKKKGN